MNREKIKQLGLPTTPGSYQFYDKMGKVIYIGKAVNLKNRVLSYWQTGANLTPAKQQLITKVERIEWISTDSEIEALLLEANLIKKYQPYYNVDLRDDKRFVYIKVSLDDEVPGLFITRTVGKQGRYFGPFVSAQAVKETLKALRKIWPYCTTRKVAKTPCFYYQIGRCLGACGGKVSVAEYKRVVIKPIIEFLEGKKEKIIFKFQVSISKLEKKAKSTKITEAESEELAKLKWQLRNMEQVLDNTRVLSTAEKYSSDVVELAKVLALPKVPERIEGYDLSNIFGREAVGSMVVFAGGEPNKNEYRKFKIKLSLRGDPITVGATWQSRDKTKNKIATPSVSLRARNDKFGDVQMLEEVLTRRFQHSSSLRKEEEKQPHPNPPLRKGREIKGTWPLPDLIVVDGGKAQLNVALKVLKNYKLDIPVLGISKGEGLRSSGAPDKLFFPNQKLPLELSLSSPALHLLKRVRDEAHRFAITYHRQLRAKSFLGNN
jgi:excinuclease ABC subunit C